MRASARRSLHEHQAFDRTAIAVAGEAALVSTPEDEHVEDDSKQARKRRRRESKLRQDAERSPDSWERFRILSDAVGEARHVVDLADHKARYALVIIGVINAGAFALMARGHLIQDLSPAGKPWLVGLLVAYAALTVAFVLHAIDCLRPRRLDTAWTGGKAITASGVVLRGQPTPLGLLFWEAVGRRDLVDYRRAWDQVQMAQINAEAEAIFHTLAGVIAAKYRALRRLYLGLGVLVAVAAVLLGVSVYLG